MDDKNFNQIAAKEWIATVEAEHSRVREVDLYPHLKGWLAGTQAVTILDIGCGQGVCSDKIDLNNRTYTGVDPSPYLLERAVELYPQSNRHFVIGNVYALPFADNSFDAAFSVALWHLLEDKIKAAYELSRVLKNSGHFLIVAANPDFYGEWIKNYIKTQRKGARFEGTMKQADGTEATDVLYLHSFDEIAASLKGAGLSIEKTTTFRTALAIEGKKL